jgi:NAD(P)-dependent dehydrogenase (short-subunit alcohol dehydrogenase family)
MATLERELRIAKSPHRASVLCPGPINTDIGRNSVRNRRDAGGAVRPTETGRKLDDKLGTALSRGMDPDEVGRLVLDAIVYGRFWIFTHPKMLRILRDQIDVMDADAALSTGRLF